MVVRPTMLQSSWFRGIVGLVLGGLVGSIWWWRRQQAWRLEQLRWELAGDIHDELASDLAGVAVMADVLLSQANLEPEHRHDLGMIRDAAGRMVEGARDIVWTMDPGHDTLEALVDRIAMTADRLLRGTRYRVERQIPRRRVPLPLETRRACFLVAKEALHNLRRHARASSVVIRVEASPARALLTVTDDGAGFDPTSEAPGHGLKSMRRRAEAVGGRLVIQSSPGRGTRLELEVPLTGFRDGHHDGRG